MISVVIPSYNRRDSILNLLWDVYAQEGCDFEVIVVDDCSSDDSAEAISREFPQVILLVNEENRGPCVTRNRGILEAKGDIIVGFDSDVTVPDAQLLAKIFRKLKERAEITGLAFRLLKAGCELDDTARWWHPLSIERHADESFQTSYFSGTGYAFRKSEMIAAGLFPVFFYMHYEEVELALRIIDHGGIITYCPELAVHHHASERSRRGEVHVYYKPRNQILLAVSCYPPWRGVCFVLPRLAYQFWVALSERHLSEYFRAIINAVWNIPRISRKVIKEDTFQKIAKFSV